MYTSRTPPLNDRIRAFYDRSSALWESVWGEHMHHGYYPSGPGRSNGHHDPRAAQAQLIDELLRFGRVEKASQILDLGCGVGGSALVLARKFGAQVTGITLSPVQAARARARAAEQGFSNVGVDAQTRFMVEDALTVRFCDGSFDLVWSLESAEHIPDKLALFRRCHQMLSPDGKLLLATWCHRSEAEAPLSRSDRALLKRICRAYALPPWVAPEPLADAARREGFSEVRTEDWSEHVQPFWSDVIASALRPRSLVGLVGSGWTTVKAALAVLLMKEGFRRGLVRYTVLSALRSQPT